MHDCISLTLSKPVIIAHNVTMQWYYNAIALDCDGVTNLMYTPRALMFSRIFLHISRFILSFHR